MVIVTLALAIIVLLLFHHILAPTLTLFEYTFMLRLGPALLYNTNNTCPAIIFTFASVTKATGHTAFFANLFAFMTPKAFHVAGGDFGVAFWVVKGSTVVAAD